MHEVMSLDVRRGEWLAGSTGISGATGATGGTSFTGTTGIVASSACYLCAALNRRWCPGEMSGFAPGCCMRKKLLKEPPICALQATLAPLVHQGPLASQVGHISPATNVHLLCNSVKNALNSHILRHIPYPIKSNCSFNYVIGSYLPAGITGGTGATGLTGGTGTDPFVADPLLLLDVLQQSSGSLYLA